MSLTVQVVVCITSIDTVYFLNYLIIMKYIRHRWVCVMPECILKSDNKMSTQTSLRLWNRASKICWCFLCASHSQHFFFFPQQRKPLFLYLPIFSFLGSFTIFVTLKNIYCIILIILNDYIKRISLYVFSDNLLFCSTLISEILSK